MLPELPGVLTAAQIARTAESIAEMAEPSGAIPWSPGAHTDIWNHVEAAMALLVGGLPDEAERALAWVPTMQRADGSWPLQIVEGQVTDASGDANASSYLAVGLWHHWLIRRDLRFVGELWPSVRAGLDFAAGMQLGWGGIAWSQEWYDGRPGRANPDALLAGSSSIYHSLRAGLALADLLGDPRPGWEAAAPRLGHAVRVHPGRFLDKSEFSMDWYYPVLGGPVRGEAGRALIDARWGEFVADGLGTRCVVTNPWVTGAETCELAMSLDALGDRARALGLLRDIQLLRDPGGAYWTGWVFGDDVHWPPEHTSYTAAAVILAVDALSRTTPGSGIMRGDTLPAIPPDENRGCGCGA